MSIAVPQTPPAKTPEWFIFWERLSRLLFLDDITTAAGAGTDGTISSRSANPLGECDGFAKVQLQSGKVVYIPYWEDVAP